MKRKRQNQNKKKRWKEQRETKSDPKKKKNGSLDSIIVWSIKTATRQLDSLFFSLFFLLNFFFLKEDNGLETKPNVKRKMKKKSDETALKKRFWDFLSLSLIFYNFLFFCLTNLFSFSPNLIYSSLTVNSNVTIWKRW